jgi:ribosomal protein S18 acetylase RimI-like enzyme
MEITLKPILQQEKHIFKDFLIDYWSEIDHNFSEMKVFLDKYLDYLFNIKKRQPYWIFLKNHRIGLILYYFYNIGMEKKGLHIAEFFIRNEYRRKGIGNRVLELLEESFPEAKELRLEVFKSNKKGYSFWKENGFKEWKYIMKKER